MPESNLSRVVVVVAQRIREDLQMIAVIFSDPFNVVRGGEVPA
jgi:hypothetical protein